MLVCNLSEVDPLPSDIDDINRLLISLHNSHRTYSYAEIKDILSNKDFSLYVVVNDDMKIVGMASLVVCEARTLTKSYVGGFISDLVVDPQYSGKRLEEELIKQALGQARYCDAGIVSLMTHAVDAETEKIYLGLGFDRMEKVNGDECFRFRLQKSGASL